MDIMRKDSEKFLEILLKMRAERGTDYINTKASDFKDIPNIEMNQSDILKDLKRNNCVSENSNLNIIGEMDIYLTLDGIDYFNDKKKEEMDKMKKGMTINVRDNAQLNLAQDNGVVYATQNNGLKVDEVNNLVKNIMDNLSSLSKDDSETVKDAIEMIQEVMKTKPKEKIISNGIKLLAPIISIANGTPVLLENLQKFVEYAKTFVRLI